MNFIKMQGLGNDFIFIMDKEENYLKDELEIAKKVCDRRFGIGADGLVIIRNSEIADAKMIIINSDGSRANMCGNAIRCFAKYLYERGIIKKDNISIETGDGVKIAELFINEDDKVDLVRVNMGKPSFKGEDVKLDNKEQLINEVVKINDKEYKLTSLLMGVPHTILINNNDEYSMDDGKIIEKSSLFRENTNVNLVKINNKESIEVKTWERGAGATLACGTGCCASLVALNRLGLCESKAKITTLGGNLIVEIINGYVFMTGEATFICSGIVLI
ncbi:diaminopimelate epimerase [Clostridium tertium]|uniref:Diaminopimelate epimerase n=1 Tax=Clostridium tertium TaxID=1559 RepID=A0A6N3GDY6_9CLOT